MDEHAIALDLGQTAIKGGLVARDGSLSLTIQTASHLHRRPEALLDDLAECVQVLLQAASQRDLEIAGLGVSSTLDVDARLGQIRSSNFSTVDRWVEYPLRAHLAGRFHLPALVENDGICAAWGEYRVGAGKGFRSVLNLTLGTGIGGGAILEDQILPDTLGSASYFGHLSLDVAGPPCPCGFRGCWELYASGSALEKRAIAAVEEAMASGRHTILGPTPTGRAVVEAAKAGDALAAELLSEVSRYLGLGMVTLANLFNPEAIVVGGGLAQAGELLLGPAREVLEAHRLPLRERISVSQAVLGAYSGVVGAGLMVWDRPDILSR